MPQLLGALYILWSGLIIGVSFLATPVKFKASLLSRPVAIEIGKVTFCLFNKVEWGVCMIAFIFTFLSERNGATWIFTHFLAVLLLIETFYLLPALRMRSDCVIAGEDIAPSKLHLFYITADALKIIIAMIGAWWLI